MSIMHYAGFRVVVLVVLLSVIGGCHRKKGGYLGPTPHPSAVTRAP